MSIRHGKTPPFLPRSACALVLTLCAGACGDSAPEHEANDAGSAPDATDAGFERLDPRELAPDASCTTLDTHWLPEWAAFERDAIRETNRQRAQAANCGSRGAFPAAGTLEAQALLRCAARRHSLDMLQRTFFDHVDPDGQGPGFRIASSGYDYRAFAENIAAGMDSPQTVVEAWMSSDGHCANIMGAAYDEVGIAYVADPNSPFGHYWTQVFGRR